MKSGRAVVSLDVINHTLPRSKNQQILSQGSNRACGPYYIDSVGTYYAENNHKQLYETCDLCSELQIQRQLPITIVNSFPTPHRGVGNVYSSSQTEWCADCGKKDVGPPCRCFLIETANCSENTTHDCHSQRPLKFNYGSYIDRHYQFNLQKQDGLSKSRSDWTLSGTDNWPVDKSKNSSQRVTNAELGTDKYGFLEIPKPPSQPAKRLCSNYRLSKSLEDLPGDIKEHILKCKCSCDHLGYGNYSATSINNLPCDGVHLTSSKYSNDELLAKEMSILNKKKVPEAKGLLWGALCAVIILGGVAGVGVTVPLVLNTEHIADFKERVVAAKALLSNTPLFDGHNDLPWNIRKFMHNKLHSFNFTANLSIVRPWSRSSFSHTDLPRLREGHVAAQFWVSYVPCDAQYLNAVQLTIEQIDLIKRLIDENPDDLSLATSAEDVEESFRRGRIASLIGVEGGHAIQNSLSVLRALHQLGVRYMTLTHTCSTPWAESARNKETDQEDPDAPRGLTRFGKFVVREMNRIGLLVDLSHVSQATMKSALSVSRAPVLFSHSSVYALCENPRNVPDDILRKVARNGGLVMISFYTLFLTCSQSASITDVIKHINHVRSLAGIDHVGIGADFDGINKLPVGLEDVSKYPSLFAELMKDPSWSEGDLKKLAGLNLLRVLRDVEQVGGEIRLRRKRPYEEEVSPNDIRGKKNCSFNLVESNPS